MIQLILNEVNVKKMIFNTNSKALEINVVEGSGQIPTVYLDTNITPELKAEGEARDIVRLIQDERKKIGTQLDEQVSVRIEAWPEAFENYIKQQALVKKINKRCI